MSGNRGNLGTAILKNKNDATEAQHKRTNGWIKHAKGLLNLSAFGLMLACSTAYASTPHVPASDTVHDSIIDWGLAVFIIIIAMFITMIVIDAKKNGRPGRPTYLDD